MSYLPCPASLTVLEFTSNPHRDHLLVLALRRDIPFQKAALADRIKGFLGSAHSDHPEGKAEKRHEFFQNVHLAHGDYFEPTSGVFPEIKTPSHYSFDSKNPDLELYFSGRKSKGPLPP